MTATVWAWERVPALLLRFGAALGWGFGFVWGQAWGARWFPRR